MSPIPETAPAATMSIPHWGKTTMFPALRPFDLLEINGDEISGSYTEKHRQLMELFSGTEKLSPVELRMTYSKDEVMGIFDEWVTGENAEGLVIL